MSPEADLREPAAHEEAWREIEDVVQGITRLARASVPAERFFEELLSSSVRTLAAVAGAVWLQRPEGLRLEHQTNLARTGLVHGPDADNDVVEARAATHLWLLESQLKTGQSRAIAPQSGSPLSGHSSGNGWPASNPTDLLLLVCPVTVDQRPVGVIEVFQRPDVSPAACQGFLRFLTVLGELASDFLRNSQLRELQDRAALWSRFEVFADAVHHDLDAAHIAAAISNDGRQLIGCDRLSVAVRRGSRYRIESVSGLASIDRRSNVIRCTEDVIRRVVRMREPVWYEGSAGSIAPASSRSHGGNGSVAHESAKPAARDPLSALPPQLADSMNRLLDVSPARTLAVIPLIPRDAFESSDGTPGVEAVANGRQSARSNRIVPVGAIVIERFEGTEDSGMLRYRSEVVARQAASALANSQQYSTLPFLSVLRLMRFLLDSFRLRALPKTLSIIVLLAGLVAALFLVPADFTITGHAELQPSLRRGVFASLDGIVTAIDPQLAARREAPFDEGHVLLTLASSELDYQLTRVRGELATAAARLETLKVATLTLDASDPDWRDKQQRYEAEEKELTETVRALTSQLQVLVEQEQQLKVTAPIHGRVLTWDAVQLLQNRPVRRGDLLLEMAHTDGLWELQIRIPDRNIDYVRRSVSSTADGPDADSQWSNSPGQVSFVLATDPEAVWTGTIREIARETRWHAEDGATVLVTVELPADMPREQLRPGATVIPHIHCGQRPIGFVWFHELIHAIRTRLLL